MPVQSRSAPLQSNLTAVETRIVAVPSPVMSIHSSVTSRHCFVIALRLPVMSRHWRVMSLHSHVMSLHSPVMSLHWALCNFARPLCSLSIRSRVMSLHWRALCHFALALSHFASRVCHFDRALRDITCPLWRLVHALHHFSPALRHFVGAIPPFNHVLRRFADASRTSLAALLASLGRFATASRGMSPLARPLWLALLPRGGLGLVARVGRRGRWTPAGPAPPPRVGAGKRAARVQSGHVTTATRLRVARPATVPLHERGVVVRGIHAVLGLFITAATFWLYVLIILREAFTRQGVGASATSRTRYSRSGR